MHGWYGGWGWLAWLTMSVVMVGFWAFAAWLVLSWFRSDDRARDHTVDRDGPASRPTAEEILATRFAAGEIDADEYHSLLNVLHRCKEGVS